MLFNGKRTFTRISAFLLILCMMLTFMPVTQAMATETSATDKSKYDGEPKTEGVSTNASAYGYIRNEYIEAYIRSDGNYTMGTVEGDPDTPADNHELLLYGHPDSTTTQTLLRIDGSDYFFSDYVTNVTFNADNTQCTATAMIAGIQVQQILTLTTNPYTNMEDQISIRYSYRNTTSVAKQVGIRIMLDTMLGDNDGAPFRVNGQDVTKEIEFTGNNVPQYWQSFDSLASPNVTATGFFYFTNGEKPDKVQFVAWPHITRKGWNVSVYESQNLTGDSAVAAYFNPRTVAAGGSNSVVTYYGISGFARGNSDLDGEIAVRITAPAELSGSDVNTGYLNNPFDVSVYMTNQGTTTIPDVRAVLNLSNTPQLSLDNSQATTIVIGDMVAAQNSAIQWTLRALPQSVDTNAVYSISLYSGNTLLKTMDVELLLRALSEEDSYCTVTFDLNGAAGTAPAPQQVPVGSFATRPQNPVREGYIFGGWYANSACTGSKWFNLFNLFLGNVVTEDVTLYAKWNRAQEITYGEDTYNFENTRPHFFSDWDIFWDTCNYKLSGEYYDTLLEGRSSAEKQVLRRFMRSDWGGSCFGMSCVLALVRAGDLDVEYFQTGAEQLYDFEMPKDNKTIFNLINYYHAMQMTDRTAAARNSYDLTEESPNNSAIIEALDSSAYPVVVGFDIRRESNNTRYGGHAVVAYKYTHDSDGYDVYIWDPNDQDAPIILYISNDFETSYFVDRWYDGTSNGVAYYSYMKYALTVESDVYDYKNIQVELMDDGYSNGNEANSVNGESADFFALYTNYSAFTITGSDGSYAVIENGFVVEGNLAISNGECMNQIGSELMLEFIIDDVDNVYTVVPVEDVSVVTGEALAAYTTTLVSAEGEDGFYASVSAETNGAVTIGADGTVSTDFEEDAQKLIEVVANDSDTAWDCVSVATVSNLTVTPDDGETVISASEDAEILVGASDGYNTIEFESVNLAANEDLSLKEDAQNPGTAVLGDQSVAMGHSVVFFTKGGSVIEAQTDIPTGECAAEPEAPTRAGFVFAGWYTSENCVDGDEWDFNTPITEDVKIYAKWLTDINYIHTVTFRAEGMDDVVIIVHNGDALSEDQIPAVPEKAGFIGAWDITDFSNITADIIVNAIYTSNLSGDADGSGVVNTRDALLILQYYTGAVTGEEINDHLCDVDGNGTINTMDAFMVLQYYTGMIDKFPIDE